MELALLPALQALVGAPSPSCVEVRSLTGLCARKHQHRLSEALRCLVQANVLYIAASLDPSLGSSLGPSLGAAEDESQLRTNGGQGGGASAKRRRA